jgi:hypothetical protein
MTNMQAMRENMDRRDEWISLLREHLLHQEDPVRAALNELTNDQIRGCVMREGLYQTKGTK